MLDITTTEYALKKKLGEEGNPLMRKKNIRRAFYPLKFIFPIIVGYYKNYSNDPLLQLFSKIVLAIMGGGLSAVVINNLWIIFEMKKQIKNN